MDTTQTTLSADCLATCAGGGHDVFSVTDKCGPAADRELVCRVFAASLRRRFTVVACDLHQLRKQVRNESGSQFESVFPACSRDRFSQHFTAMAGARRIQAEETRDTIMTRPGHRLPQALDWVVRYQYENTSQYGVGGTRGLRHLLLSTCF